MPTQRVVAYGADTMNSLSILERTCERDESRLTSKIVKLQLAEVDGKKAIAATYEEVDDIKVGHLSFEEYKTAVDKQSLTAIHISRGETVALEDGEAYIKGTELKVLVFRDKP